MAARILVVEDEFDILDLVVFILEGQGYSVFPVAGAEEALRECARTRPDLFLIDLMLPEMTGTDLATRLRSGGFAHTPMIAMTASLHLLPSAEKAGVFNDIVAKPFDLNALLNRIRELTTSAGENAG